MNLGTKSLLYGVHNPLIHGFFIFLAWWKLYGFPFNPKLWVCFLLHDIGYWGCKDVDGIEGKLHPYRGANLVSLLCDSYDGYINKKGKWYNLCVYHSRYVAGINKTTPSRLCVADKAATIMMPVWLYLTLGRLTGEIYHYMAVDNPKTRLHPEQWLTDVRRILFFWVVQHKEVA